VPWAGRSEDKADAGVWAVTCFFVRAGFRRQGVSYALARTAVGFARAWRAQALAGYPMLTALGREIAWGEMSVGARSVFEAAGFREVSRPSPRRLVMRVQFG
jgi:GNAT superfamily N-acetyltransferase